MNGGKPCFGPEESNHSTFSRTIPNISQRIIRVRTPKTRRDNVLRQNAQLLEVSSQSGLTVDGSVVRNDGPTSRRGMELNGLAVPETVSIIGINNINTAQNTAHV